MRHARRHKQGFALGIILLASLLMLAASAVARVTSGETTRVSVSSTGEEGTRAATTKGPRNR